MSHASVLYKTSGMTGYQRHGPLRGAHENPVGKRSWGGLADLHSHRRGKLGSLDPGGIQASRHPGIQSILPLDPGQPAEPAP